MDFTGIHALVFSTPDMKTAQRFYSDWGLNGVGSTGSAAVFETAVGSRITVQPETAEGPPPPAAPGMHFREVVWGVATEDALAAVRREIARDRETRMDDDGTLHCTGPGNIAVGFRVWRSSSDVEAPRAAVNGFDRIERIDRRAPIYSRTRPIRMGHIGFVLPDIEAAEAFYCGRLGFPVSDRYAGGAAAFLRCAEEEDHHNLFLIRSRDGKTAFDHVAFEVRDVHEVFAGGLHVDRNGWKTRVGPGRHPVSSAYFWYFESPCEGAVEYYADSDHVTANWKPTVFRTGRFSEWHLVDGIPEGGQARRKTPGVAVETR